MRSVSGDNFLFYDSFSCLAEGDALVYLAGPIHKKYSTTFVWGHPYSTYVFHDRFFNTTPSPPLPFTHRHAFRVTPFCVCDFIDLILSFPISTLLVCHTFLILFYLRNSGISVLPQTVTFSWHFIQFPVAYVGRPFR